MVTERNLLFAVLAFESEFLDLTQLTSACRAWAENKSQPLADLLVARGWLTVKNREFIDELLERKLAKHQHDPRVTLNSVVRGDVCDAIKQVEDADIQHSLSSWPSSGPVLIETIGETLTDSEQPKSRYTWLSEVGKGGLGKVWLARDNDLAREVALKEVKPGSASAEAVRRLIKEAQITGQLQHPNIVPVYEVNRGGRPFYTMKLVKGETLSKAITKHHEQRRAARSAVPPQPEDAVAGLPTEPLDPLSGPRLMSVFLNVCDAIGYAHSRGIIHRDLKPENIVLGDHGEAIVLDWGLAKKISERDDGTESILLTDDAQTNASRAGGAKGSLPWMPPEQAAGRLDEIDQRSDVYGLGAILFHILTGQPPHTGGELQASLQRIIAAPTPSVRDLDPSISEELDAICANAMAKVRAERYQTAKDLKTALQEYEVHKSSIDLAIAASVELHSARITGDYQDYSRALAGFEEALRQWPDNAHATTGLSDARAAYARAAFANHDYELALSLTQTDDEFRATIQKAAADRVSRRKMKRATFWSTISVFVICTLYWSIKLSVEKSVTKNERDVYAIALNLAELELSDACFMLGDSSLLAGRMSEARLYYEKACVIRAHLALAEQADRDHFGLVKKMEDDKDRELFEAVSKSSMAQRELILAHCDRGQISRQIGNYAMSVAEFETAISIIPMLKSKEKEPSLYDLKRPKFVDLALLFDVMMKRSSSDEEYRRSRVNRTTEENPLEGDITPFLRILKSEIELTKFCEQVMAEDWTLIEKLPTNERFTHFYGRVCVFSNGEHFYDAAETLDRWVALLPTNAAELYWLARGYGVLYAALPDVSKGDDERRTQRQKRLDDGLNTIKTMLSSKELTLTRQKRRDDGLNPASLMRPLFDQSPASRQKLLDDGLSTLRKAIEAGYSDFDQIAIEPDLAPLREHPGYKELVEQLRSKSEDSKPKRDDVK